MDQWLQTFATLQEFDGFDINIPLPDLDLSHHNVLSQFLFSFLLSFVRFAIMVFSRVLIVIVLSCQNLETNLTCMLTPKDATLTQGIKFYI